MKGKEAQKERKMQIGKLGNGLLESLILHKFKKTREEVLEPPKIGADCARVKLDSGIAVLSTDPITAASTHLGFLTVHVNCNDAAAAGAEPIGLLVTLLAPPGTKQEELAKIADDIQQAASAINVDIIGGHTEITSAVTRIITSSTVIAQPIAKPLTNTANVGDCIVMTKTVGIEGTSVIAYDCEHKLNNLSESEIEVAKSLLNEISVVKEGLFAAQNGATLMHDVTEGGILGALWEMAYNSDKGLEIDLDEIDIHPVTKKICDNLEIEPYRLLSSGCMLIVCKNGKEMVQGLRSIGINAKVIAKITDKAHGVKTTKGEAVAAPQADELFRVI